ncbi:MAG: LuxR C-terminal-related transcriptional regulator [Flavobacteriaceae bacterium]
MKKTVITFSIIALSLLGLLQISTYSVTAGVTKIELVIAMIALVFLGIGIWISKKKPSQNNTVETNIPTEKITELGLSAREYEILQKISQGYSNKEIGEQLFVSENTVKTHVSNLFQKLEAKRRTQAVQKAKDLNILP